MKKVMIILSVIALTFASCKKENVSPVNIENTEDCNCGRIVEESTSNVLTEGTNGAPGLITMYYDYRVKNNCSGTVRWFKYAEESIYKSHYIGDTFCSTKEW